ncbi:copper chaperone PCu(A)C [Sulfitobacter aestuariivivens]|uniref:Copper chaperone PCu(A)C n=1 Tax=Sulfitobacter aestuariivivens TaxID=2766981 RepID=A0A927HDE2_9RHOB|nr:copper chaperone PCu(A)C [Sulfitobacter aestuariivivens]MBD3662334.1 copper chaperone PCu(A)C [Sulfitobacter aestuariivivens]
MLLKRPFAAAAVALLSLSAPLLADGIMIKDAYVRSSTPSSPTGAAFMVLMNNGDVADRLISATSDVAKRVELHTHMSDDNGVMTMMEIEDGILLEAGGTHTLRRGGDHVMFMGLAAPLVQGEEITVTLTFETAGEIEVTIPVDHARKPDHGAMNHGDDS